MNKNTVDYGHFGSMDDFLTKNYYGTDHLLKYYNEETDGRFYRMERKATWRFRRLCRDTVLYELKKAIYPTTDIQFNVEYLDDTNYAVIVRAKPGSRVWNYLTSIGYETV